MGLERKASGLSVNPGHTLHKVERLNLDSGRRAGAIDMIHDDWGQKERSAEKLLGLNIVIVVQHGGED
jgi:hypothetical protein